MKFLYALIFLVVVSAVVCDKNQDRFKHKTNKKWQEYKKHHQKSFKHDDEEEKRFKNFLKTDDLIEKNKEELKEGKVHFALGHNEFSDLSEEEKKQMLGAKRPEGLFNLNTNGFNLDIKFKRDTTYNPVNKALPASVDWTTSWNQPIRHQGSCGSCWAFATCAAMEFQYWKQKGQIATCSTQYLVDCSPNSQYSTNGCNGGWFGGAINFIKASGGNPADASYPYTGVQGGCKSVSSRVFKASDAIRIKVGSESDLMNAVAFQGPVITCINASGTFGSYKSGVFRDASTIDTDCNHAVLIVGYGSEKGQNFWKIRNSWGSSWGDNGYIKLARDGRNYGELLNWNVIPAPATM